MEPNGAELTELRRQIVRGRMAVQEAVEFAAEA